MKVQFAAIFFCALSVLDVRAADALLLERFVLQTTSSGGARVIGIVRNNSSSLIVHPVLEVKCTTSEDPDLPMSHRLVMTVCLKGGESRAFHTGEFFGPPQRTPDGDSRPQKITAIVSCRILPGSMIPASADWMPRVVGRDDFVIEAAKISMKHDERWLSGTIATRVGTRVHSAQFTAAYYDAAGDLIDVRTFRIGSRNGECIDSFPYEFTVRAGPDDPSVVPVSVKCLCEQAEFCP